MSGRAGNVEAGKVDCPKCGKKVDRVDGEYARHYSQVELCTMSRREILKEETHGHEA